MKMTQPSSSHQSRQHSIIDHVAIVVDDINKAAHWYQDKFDCRLTWHDESWAYLQFDNCGLALVTEGHHPAHFAIRTGDLDRSLGQPKAHRDGTRSIYLYDPDGNAVEMIERQPSHLPVVF